MKTQSTDSQDDDYRLAFLRHLPKRLEVLEQRIVRYRRDGWEAGGMALLADDAQRLAGTSGRYDLIEASQHLLTLEQLIGEHIARRSLPEAQQAERMLALIRAVTASLASQAVPQPSPQGVSSAPLATTAPAPGLAAEASESTANVRSKSHRIYILSDGNGRALELAHQLEADGCEVETPRTADDLSELLFSQPPALVLVDSSRMSDAAAAGSACRSIQEHTPHSKLQLIAMAATDNVQSRLDARRAGADAVLFPPFKASDVLAHLQVERTPVAEEKLRVLIVEDDRAQALFAQSVLANAGMHAQVEQDPLRLLEALESLRPDLVLMDLHMPNANGVELTELIRDHPTFMHTPIVFLSGDEAAEARFDAIGAGGDDFLSKPIRPRRLIDSVNHRIRRTRAVQRPEPEPPSNVRDKATGLHERGFVLDRVNDALDAGAGQRRTDPDSPGSGALYLEVDGAAALRDRFGLAVLERLLVNAGSVLASELKDQYPAAQIGDDAFLVLATGLDDNALDTLARRLRDTLMRHSFEAGGERLRLQVSVGVCPLRFGFDEASALLDAAERACRDARVGNLGIKRYQPLRRTEQSQEAARIEQLREALAKNAFGLIYQPIVAVQGNAEAQYQTLLRMRDANGRQLPAAEILPLAERAGLMLDIDRWVLSRAMSVVRGQRDFGRSIRLFVPQSMSTLAAIHGKGWMKTDLAAIDQAGWLKAELAAHEMTGSALVLECRLEDALLNPPALTTFTNALYAEGIQLCLSQFERSNEANRLLQSIPLGFIKLAGKYVAANAAQELRDDVRVMIDFAHRLGIHVIGHQVEDAQAAANLWLSGVDFIQGNLVQSAASELAFDFSTAVL